jgi:flagellar M-ring protein FliF
MLEYWEKLDRRARIGLAAGLTVILALVLALAAWVSRPDYQVLFSELAPRDAAAMAAELDKLKTPYQLADNGNTILVPKDLVYKTRLKLMGTEVPLHGAVGFEVFNNADFGMTDFVQKVNYQRAIQGELTRTILSIEAVQAARVHLAIPEQGLFKKAAAKPKASVTITMKPGHELAPEQVVGIQRLVAASVPDIAMADVTVLDQRGLALSKAASGDIAGGEGGVQLDTKRSMEDYLHKKVAQVLDRTFGPGEALATVDVSLNLDQSRVTTEEVLPARGAPGDSARTGVVVRERRSNQESDAAADPSGIPGKTARQGGNSTSEADYQVGRRVEQLSVAPGAVRRITVAVVVKKTMSEDQRTKLGQVVALALGLNTDRGDAIVVNTMDDMVNAVVAKGNAEDAPPVQAGPKEPVASRADARIVVSVLSALAGGVLLGAFFYFRRPARKKSPRLDEASRARMLADVQRWINSPASADMERQ